MYKILFVCTGNICRSPTAHGVLRQKLLDQGWQQQVQVESAGTHDYHGGEPADYRTQKHAMRRGYELSDLRARLLQDEDFARFDLIVAMGDDHMRFLQRRCAPVYQHKLRYFTAYCSSDVGLDVPDPYYGEAADFERVLELVEDGCEHLLEQLQPTLAAANHP